MKPISVECEPMQFYVEINIKFGLVVLSYGCYFVQSFTVNFFRKPVEDSYAAYSCFAVVD